VTIDTAWPPKRVTLNDDRALLARVERVRSTPAIVVAAALFLERGDPALDLREPLLVLLLEGDLEAGPGCTARR